MNTNQTSALVVKCYDNTYQVCVDLGAYVRANAPDEKASNKARTVLLAHSDMQYARDLLYYLHGAFDALSERSYYKAAGRDKPEHDKHTARADFYRDIAKWAKAGINLVKKAPVITANDDVPEKDAEDDSDPYVKPAPKADMVEHARAALQERLTVADFSKRRIDVAAALFKSVVLERPVGATVLDILERFGDEASELSWADTHDAARFWDACVHISDDLRSDLAADPLKNASTVTVPEPDAGMWEVTGDPHWALYRTRTAAERAARECFPDENSSQRYARLHFRTIKP